MRSPTKRFTVERVYETDPIRATESPSYYIYISHGADGCSMTITPKLNSNLKRANLKKIQQDKDTQSPAHVYVHTIQSRRKNQIKSKSLSTCVLIAANVGGFVVRLGSTERSNGDGRLLSSELFKFEQYMVKRSYKSYMKTVSLRWRAVHVIMRYIQNTP